MLLPPQKWLLVKGRRRRRSRSSVWVLRWPKERMCLGSATSSPPSTTPSFTSLTSLGSTSAPGPWRWGSSCRFQAVSDNCFCFQGDDLPRDRRDEGEGGQRRVVSVRCHVGGSGRGSALQRAGNHSAAHQAEGHWGQQVNSSVHLCF